MIRNYLPLMWKISYVVTVILLIVNLTGYYILKDADYFDRFMPWLFLALFITIALRLISDHQGKKEAEAED